MRPRLAIVGAAIGGGAAPADSVDGLYQRHLKQVKRWARWLGGPTVDLEDLVHDIFLVAFKKGFQGRGEGSIETWLFRITHHVVRSKRRRAQIRRLLFGRHQATLAPPSPNTPQQELERRERHARLYQALDRLPDRYRTTLILYEIEELSADCADRANRVALVIAVWAGELPAHATGAPNLAVAAPVLAPVLPAKPTMVTEVGLSGFYSMVGGAVPGALIELGRLRREGWWGTRGTAGYQSARSLQVDIGISRYDRALLGAAMVLQWNHPWVLLAGDLGLVGAYTRAHGDGYSQNESTSGFNVGLAADGRAGLRLGAYRVWADGRLHRWARRETIRVDSLTTGPSSMSTLSAWDVHVGLGVGVVFD